MKYMLLLIFCTIYPRLYILGQFPVYVHKIDAVSKQKTTIKGNLSMGAPMDNLSWAWRNRVKCFPVNEKGKFSGNHVLYYLQIPGKTKLQIVVAHETRNTALSIYAYSIAVNDYATVPEMKDCLQCESDYVHENDKPKSNHRIVLLQTDESPANVIIGVVGSEGAKQGNYIIEITLSD